MFEQNFVKHIGALASTGAKVAVVYMQLPDAPEKALIFDLDAIPRDVADDIDKLLRSPESQSSKNLADILSRRSAARTDGPVLNWLHHRGYLKAVNITEIVMTPTPYIRTPLVNLLNDMKKVELGLDMNTPQEIVDAHYNASLGVADARLKDHSEAQAMGLRKTANDLRLQAKLLMAEADKKDERAAQIMEKFIPKPTPVQATAPAPVDGPKKRGRKKKVNDTLNTSNTSIFGV